MTDHGSTCDVWAEKDFLKLGSTHETGSGVPHYAQSPSDDYLSVDSSFVSTCILTSSSHHLQRPPTPTSLLCHCHLSLSIMAHHSPLDGRFQNAIFQLHSAIDNVGRCSSNNHHLVQAQLGNTSGTIKNIERDVTAMWRELNYLRGLTARQASEIRRLSSCTELPRSREYPCPLVWLFAHVQCLQGSANFVCPAQQWYNSSSG